MSETADKAKRTGQDIDDSQWFDRLIRGGLVAYGVVHLLIGYLAIQMALGDKSGSISSTGALKELAEKPFGSVLLWLVTVGFFVLVLWRLLEMFVPDEDDDEDDPKKKWGKRAASGLKAVLYAVLGVSAFKVATGNSSSGGGGGTDSMTAKLMDLPAGQVLVGLVGLGVIGYGGFLAWQGLSDKHAKKLESEGKSGKAGRAYLLSGKIGHVAKGAAIAAVGCLFVWAAVTHDAKKSGGMDQAFGKVLDQPFGAVLIGLVGAGIACYGVFALARARHLSR